MDLRAGQTVLDVAAGNGNISLAAAGRWCEVTSTDYVESLLALGRERAEAERLQIKFQFADTEYLPFASASFDAVVSTSAGCSAPIRIAPPSPVTGLLRCECAAAGGERHRAGH